MNALPARNGCGLSGERHGLRALARALLLVLCVAAPCAARAEEAIALRQDGPRLVAERVAGDCRAQLALDVDAAAAGFRDDCQDDLSASAARLGALFDAIARREPRVRALQSLDCGRLALLPGQASLRLARAAQADPGWQQALRARAAGGEAGANRWVAAAVSTHGVLREHADALRARGLAVRAVGVEKVLVGSVGAPPAPPMAVADGIEPGTELPWDAIVWLRLAPVPDSPIH